MKGYIKAKWKTERPVGIISRECRLRNKKKMSFKKFFALALIFPLYSMHSVRNY